MIYSTIIYLSVFSAALFFTNKADRAIKKKSNLKFKFYTVLAIGLPCLLAALRGSEVGTDTIRFNQIYEHALRYNDFAGYFADFSLQGLETGFLFFDYGLSRLQFPAAAMLFVFELIIILPIYWFSIRNSDKRPAWVYMAVFYFVFYNVSYNATRQLAAVSCILVASYMLSEKKIVLGLVFSMISFLFHRTSYIGIVFILLGFIYQNLRMSFVRQIALLCGFIMLALFPLYFDKIFDFLSSIGLISERNSFYSLVFSGTTGNSALVGLGLSGYFSIIMRILFFVFPVIFLFASHHLTEQTIRSTMILVFIGTIFYASAALAFNTIHVYRITMYAEIFIIPFFALLHTSSRDKFSLVVIPIRNLLFISTLVIYWFMTFMWFNYHQTNNYLMM